MKTSPPLPRLAFTLVLVFVLAQVPAWGTSRGSEPAIAETDLSGTILSIRPAIPFRSATLRVTGPDGYEAITWSEGGDLVLDLVADRSDWQGGDPSPTDELVVAPVLADGRYGYEAVFYLEGDDRRLYEENFLVQGGAAMPGVMGLPGESGTRSSGEPATVARGGGLRNVSAASASTDDTYLIGDGEDDAEVSLQIRADTTGGATINWIGIMNKDGDLRLWEDSAGSGPTNNQLVTLEPSGNMGVGTTQPGAALHIFRPDPFIRLASSTPCPNPNGTWVIGPALGRFDFSVGTGCSGDAAGQKMSIQGDGNVGIGTVSPAARLHVVGSGIIEGDVALGSSRTIKHEIEPLNTERVLASIRELPLYRWKYKDDPVQAPHVGPVAEDVFETFEIGRDEKHLSPADSAGLALAGVQGVDRNMEELRAVVEMLTVENRRLLERLATLEARLAVPQP